MSSEFFFFTFCQKCPFLADLAFSKERRKTLKLKWKTISEHILQWQGDSFNTKMPQQPMVGHGRFTHCWIEYRMSVMAGNKKQKKRLWERYHMAVWATSNRKVSLKAEVLFDITYKVERRSDLDFVRCVKQIYNLVLDVNCRECRGYLWTVTDWQKVKQFLGRQWTGIAMKVKKTGELYET